MAKAIRDTNSLSCAQFLRLREKVNWEVKDERIELLRELGEYIREWQIQSLPDVGYVFRPEEIDLLFSDSLIRPDGVEFIDFVVRKGYTDEPKRDEDGKPLLRRTTPLHRVLRYNISGREEKIRQLFKIYNKFDMNYADDSGLTHFHVACFLGFQDIITEFLEVGQDPNCIWQETGESGLHLILEESGSQDLVELLLKHDANPNHANYVQGMTPLHLICYKYSYNIDLFNMVFELSHDKYQPVQVDAQDTLGNTPLHCAAYRCCKNMIELLLRKDANPNLANVEGMTPLHLIRVKNNGDEDSVNMLFELSNGKYQPVQVDVQDKLGNTPLHYAAYEFCENLMELLLRKDANPNLANVEGLTPLHIVCIGNSNNIDLVNMLFELSNEKYQPVQVDVQDKLGNTPLHYAAYEFCENLMELLLRKDANPNLANVEGLTPLHIVCIGNSNNIDLVNMLFELSNEKYQPVQVDVQDKLGNTPLHYAAYEFCENLMELLLRKDANPNLANVEGLTPLHIVCIGNSNNIDLVNMLFELSNEKYQPVQVDVQDKLGNTPLHYAAYEFCENLMELLLRKDANPNLANVEGLTPLHIVCIGNSNNIDLVNMLFELSNEKYQPVQVDVQDKLGNTPLHYAAYEFCENLMELLLRKDANPNLANVEGLTPLHIVCIGNSNNIDLVNMLFELSNEKYQPVQVDVQDKLGNTPLHYAAYEFCENLMELLLRKDANPNLANVEGLTPLHIVCIGNSNNIDLVNMLFELSNEKYQPVQVDVQDKLDVRNKNLTEYQTHGL
ncbi:ankyrin-1-like [Trichogramma pretiosum]|uniref:ankyrin-1-like n=1 Tax=Trichogramma pretiosum TaxID=7493 RepID=UPI000C71969A|nr:ankyrin-1-like [Trichogramma pretiosum]